MIGYVRLIEDYMDIPAGTVVKLLTMNDLPSSLYVCQEIGDTRTFTIGDGSFSFVDYVPGVALALGVQVNQYFKYKDFPGKFHVDEDGRIIGEYGVDFTPYLVDALNHPEHIIRNPKLSENELAIINAFPEVGKIRNDAALVVHLYDKNDKSIATIDASLFPNIPKNYVIENWDEWQNDN